MDYNEMDISVRMAGILGTMMAFLGGLLLLQTPREETKKSPSLAGDHCVGKAVGVSRSSSTERVEESSSSSSFLPSAKTHPSKRAYEIYVACYTPIWIGAFGVIILFQLYEDFTAWSYIHVCGGLALPFVLQPIFYPSAGSSNSPDAQRPLLERYSFKANVWIAVYSFIGNYWYTHYFYSVLKAKYTMPSAHRLNNVPIAMFLATHFYFSTYHFFSNALLRKVTSTYRPGFARNILFVSVVIVFSYFTAFMETLTISSYPYYDFEDRDMAYTVGSAFYGIYFLVSFPGFYYFDDEIDSMVNGKKVTLWDTFVSSCGHGMMILTLLDAVRLYLDIPLIVGSTLETICKSEVGR